MYGYRCEWCEGMVREKAVNREVFPHRDGYVILENIVIGVCDRCGQRYYTAELVHKVDDVATGKTPARRTETVPVA